MPQHNWANLDVVCDSLGGSFIDGLQANARVQCVGDATRGGNIFDLVITNDPFLIQEVNVDVPFNTSDHNRAEFKFNCNNTVLIRSNNKLFTDYSAVHWGCFNDYICNVDWFDVYSAHDSADKRWSAFLVL